MTEGPEWQPTFDAVKNIPGTKTQEPEKKGWKDRQRDVAFLRNRQKADTAVALGAVDTGDDFDPDWWLNLWAGERVNNESQAAADIIALDGRVTALEGGGVVTTYTVSGTWTNPSPADHVAIQVICVNGGDGGGRGSSAIVDTIKGGQSGGYMQKSLFTDELPSTVAMTIGAGGAGATSTGRGGIGGVTSFGTYVEGLKGVGAVLRDGSYSTGIPPGGGGDGANYDDASNAYAFPSTNGEGGPFAPGGYAGFGTTSTAVDGLAGGTPPANIPSGGGGGGGGSIAGGLAGSGKGGAGGFPGGGGGGGAIVGSAADDGGNGATGCIYVITPS